MSLLENLTKIKHKSKKRVGRGQGSDKGKTSGRGMDGQRGRSRVRPGFEGGQTSLLQRLPKLPGWRFSKSRKSVGAVNVEVLNNNFSDGDTVDVSVLREKSLVPQKVDTVKILGAGTLEKELTVEEGIRVSKKAKEKIEAAGGAVEG